MPQAPERLLRLIAFGLVALAAVAAVNELKRSVALRPETRAGELPDPASSVLWRCRELTLAEAGTDAACEAAWEESRRRFLSASDGQRPSED